MRPSKIVAPALAMIASLIACNGIIGTRDITFDGDASSGATTDGASSSNDGSTLTDGTTTLTDGAVTDSAPDCTGIDLTTSSANCGTCGHDCLGGQCSGSKCQPVPIVTSVGQPYALAVDSTNVYFSDVSTGVLYALPKNSPAGTIPSPLLTVADPLLYDLVLDGNTLYFSYGSDGNKGAIEAVYGDGGARRGVMLDGSVPRGISIDSLNVYYATPDDDQPGVYQVARNTSGAKPVAVSSNEPLADLTFVDGVELFWSGESQTNVRHCTLPNCIPGTFITGLDGQNAITSNKNFLFFSDFETLFISAKTGSTATGTAFAAQQPQPYSIAVDDKDVFWVNTGTSGMQFMDGDVRRCPILATTGAPACAITNGEIVATSTKNPRIVALDATAVYWTVQYEGTVYRLAR